MLLAAAGLGAGRLFSGRILRRKEFLAAFGVFLGNLSTAMRYSGDDIFTLVTLSAGELSELKLKYDDRHRGFEQTWSKSVSAVSKKYALSSRDVTLLKEFGSRLGKTDLEGQLCHLELYRAMFAAQLAEAEQAVASKAKLYRTLGLFGGVSSAIILL